MTSLANYKHVPVRVVMDKPVNCRFDYPDQADGQFLFSIPSNYSGNCTDLFERALGGIEGRIRRVRQVPIELEHYKVFSINERVPDFIKRRLGHDREVPGPNCYQAALASAGFFELEGRYVDPLEAGFYFSRYFETQSMKPQLGDLRIYYRSHMVPAETGFARPEPAMIDILGQAHDINPAVGAAHVHAFNVDNVPDWVGTVLDEVPTISDEGLEATTGITTMASVVESSDIPAIKPGVHAAVVLLGGTVFQRGGWHDDHTNMIVPAAMAMSSIEPISDDPFYPVERADDGDYKSKIIKRLSDSKFLERSRGRVVDQELTAVVSEYLLLMDYYSKKIQEVAEADGSFSKNRLSLLTMENIWNVLSELEEKVRDGSRGMAQSLLMMRDDVAQEFLRFRSLKWQYSAMVQRFSTLSRTAGRRQKIEYMQDLYREHYVDPDSDEFASEINIHLRSRGIPTQRFPAIRAHVIEQVKALSTEDHLMRYAESNGSDGIDFFGILDRAIAEVDSSPL